MRWTQLIAACLLLTLLIPAAPAGIFFKRKPKPKPAERVPELVVLVKTEQDDRKRAAAAAELRQYDPKAFPEIVPILIDVVRNDPKASVRTEAVSGLSKIRPVTQEAGMALEYAAAHDPSFRVRMQAKTALTFYRWAGYRSPKLPETAKPGETREPPLAVDSDAPADKHRKPRSAGPVIPPKDPKDIDPSTPITEPDPNVARPLPEGPRKSPLVPAKPPKLEKPPASSKDEGPSLTPPQT